MSVERHFDADLDKPNPNWRYRPDRRTRVPAQTIRPVLAAAKCPTWPATIWLSPGNPDASQLRRFLALAVVAATLRLLPATIEVKAPGGAGRYSISGCVVQLQRRVRCRIITSALASPPTGVRPSTRFPTTTRFSPNAPWPSQTMHASSPHSAGLRRPAAISRCASTRGMSQ